ncbi:MAG TPA: four helix bundle protein [Flavobacterium sp.]|jgi:four helix bundle protein
MHNYKKLEIWRQSRKLCSDVYAVTAGFPADEKYGITNQLRRACVSIPSNIAEGSSRKSNKDFSRFLEMAIGSGYEMETQLLIAVDLNFTTPSLQEPIAAKLADIIKMISSFRSGLI